MLMLFKYEPSVSRFDHDECLRLECNRPSVRPRCAFRAGSGGIGHSGRQPAGFPRLSRALPADLGSRLVALLAVVQRPPGEPFGASAALLTRRRSSRVCLGDRPVYGLRPRLQPFREAASPPAVCRVSAVELRRSARPAVAGVGGAAGGARTGVSPALPECRHRADPPACSP
jgi:hypothetical protein